MNREEFDIALYKKCYDKGIIIYHDRETHSCIRYVLNHDGVQIPYCVSKSLSYTNSEIEALITYAMITVYQRVLNQIMFIEQEEAVSDERSI